MVELDEVLDSMLGVRIHLQEFFNVEGLKLLDWIIIIIGSSLVLWVRELWNLLKTKRQPE